MTDLMPAPEPELEDAIRRGFEVGLGSAPVVGDLAERVRALPQPRRHLTVLAVAASVVVVLLAIGLIVTLPDRNHKGSTGPIGSSTSGPTLTSPSPTSTLITGPPYPVNAPTNDKTTASRAVGTWVPVWIAGYDGPLVLAKPSVGGPLLRVQFEDGTSGTKGRYHLGGSGGCPHLGGGVLSPTGRLLSQDPVPAVLCESVETLDVAMEFAMADLSGANLFGAFHIAQVVVSLSGVLTINGDGTPLAQFVREGEPQPSWTATGDLPSVALGSWSVIPDRQGAPLGGLTNLTLKADGQYTGATRCATLSGTYEIAVDGHATFSSPTVRDHSCPYSSAIATGSLTDVARVAHYANYLTLYDKNGAFIASLQ